MLGIGLMKQIATRIGLLMIAAPCVCSAIVSGGSIQTVIITKTNTTFVYTVDDGTTFTSADACGKHCWDRSTPTKSKWSNSVRIYFRAKATEAERQLIGDWFVANYVYPSFIAWTEDGEEKKAAYKPNSDNFEKIRKLRKKRSNKPSEPISNPAPETGAGFEKAQR